MILLVKIELKGTLSKFAYTENIQLVKGKMANVQQKPYL